jgi:UDP-GlcNAc3NAcA epimerase
MCMVNQQLKLTSIVGARPQFIKLAPLTELLDSHYHHISIHTGQHFDKNMSAVFYEQMGMRRPDIQLESSAGGHSEQTGNMMIKLEEVFIKESPSMVIVFGDTNSTLAAGLAASKLNIPIFHIESGLRSNDRRMPEEINRVIIDKISTLLSAPTKQAILNLENEGITKNVFNHGDIMLDAQQFFLERLQTLELSEDIELINAFNSYSVLTIHRPSNTDSKEMLWNIMQSLNHIDHPIVFPIHPRTNKMLTQFGIDLPNHVKKINPLGYTDMLRLVMGAELILTDSGGLQKEAYFLNKKCITYRDTTEWGETLEDGCNTLVLTDPSTLNINKLRSAINSNKVGKFNVEQFGDGQSAKKMVATINLFLNTKSN